MRTTSSPRAGTSSRAGSSIRAGLGAALLVMLAPAVVSSTPQDRTLEYECGEFSTILEDGRWVQHVTPAVAAVHGTSVNDVALHLFLARERLMEDVECIEECPPGNPQTCQPAATFAYETVIGIPEPLTGGYSCTFFGVDATRGCDPCY